MIELELLKNPDGTYPADIASILSTDDPKKKAILRKVGTMVVKHSQYYDVWEWLEDMFNDVDTGLEASAGLLYGPSGVGKTTIIRKFVEEYGGPFRTPKGKVRPVVRVSTPSNPTLPNIQKALLVALGAEEVLSNNPKDLQLVVMTQLRGQDVKLLIFDEFTHIVEDRSEKFAGRAVRGLKELLGENVCQCVFAGTESLPSIHGIYGQFRRRGEGDMCLRPFDWSDEEDRKEWIKIMEMIQKTLPMKCATPLGGKEMALKMHRASNGILDHVMKMLFRATSFTYDDGADLIPDAKLSLAYERLRRGDLKSINPFGPPPRGTREIKIVEDTSADDANDEVTNLRPRRKRKPDFKK